jgi:hypothetical protein
VPLSFDTIASGLVPHLPAHAVQTSTCQWSTCHEALDYTSTIPHWNECHLFLINQLWKLQSLRLQRTFCLWNDCHKAFSRPSDLDRHVQSIHFGVHSHCTVIGCSNNRGNGFSRADKLRNHEKKAHGMH